MIRKVLKPYLDRLKIGKRIQQDIHFIEVGKLNKLELSKPTRRDVIINFLITLTEGKNYLEIGVRDPKKNFERIIAENKYSVDPGLEFDPNPVDFKMTSDFFFDKLQCNEIKKLTGVKFDVIFVDGMHIASQVDKDIENSLKFIKEDGFIVLHDCNPPSEFHQRESQDYKNSPARGLWNGTTWKAFYKYRHQEKLYSICFDTDWGVGVISKRRLPLFNTLPKPIENNYFEFKWLDEKRTKFLNLQDFESWKESL